MRKWECEQKKDKWNTYYKKTMWFGYQMEVPMTEREKMLAGELYDCGDAELLTQWHKAKDLVRDYNQMNSADADEKERILNELLGGKGKNLWITAPFYVDYGNNIYFGNNCEVNMNCTFLDDNIIRIGDTDHLNFVKHKQHQLSLEIMYGLVAELLFYRALPSGIML